MRSMDTVLSRTTQAGGTITVTAQIPTVCLVKAWRIVIGTHKLISWNQRSLWSEEMCSKIGRPYSRFMNLLKFPSIQITERISSANLLIVYVNTGFLNLSSFFLKHCLAMQYDHRFFYSRYMAEYYRYDVKPHIIHQSITTVFTWFNQVTLLTDNTFALPNHGHLFYEVSMFSLPFVIINVVLLLVYVIKFYVFQ